MSAKPKTPIKSKTIIVPAAPARTAAKSIRTASTKLAAKADVKLNSVQPVAKPAKPGVTAFVEPLPAATIQAVAIPKKQAKLIASLRSSTGMTIDDMMSLTGWQAHSLRGVISGALRKRLGLNVVTSPSANGQSRVYRIVDQVSA